MGSHRDKLKPTGGDVAHTLVRAALSAVPVAGGPAAEVFAAIVAPPLARRRDRWIEEIAAAVEELQKKVAELTPAKLSQNEGFVSTLLHATHVAQRNHQAEKIEALRNAVMNAALPSAPTDDLQQIFLNYIDDLTPRHLSVLALLSDPVAWAQKHNLKYPPWSSSVAPAQVLEFALPELRGRREFYDQLVRDLEVRGLLKGRDIHTMMTTGGAFSSGATELAEEFLKFISNPTQG